MVATKLKYVIMPNARSDRCNQLRNWDLWGPLLLSVVMALTLSISSNSDSDYVFGIVFLVVAIGSLLITINCKLLGAKVSIF